MAGDRLNPEGVATRSTGDWAKITGGDGQATVEADGWAKATGRDGQATIEDDAEVVIRGTDVKDSGGGSKPRLKWFTLTPKRSNRAQGR